MASQEDPFRAIADPTRRRILDLLAEHGTLSVGRLADEFPDLVSSGISKHLMVLRAADLVVADRSGRHQLYMINASGIRQAFGPWVTRYEAYWTDALGRLKALAETTLPTPLEGNEAE
ncbi:metalloregulator ArsR/SmtB family transcription factor [Nakamurella lactea]|uniref:metalloregulator ArsR/SmtB family transcription factor n=1 Tax=Nakamurella lactea TaxID=459515 RepID=UPI00041B1D0E|nr:metalloregulator ArsR/SmtB family transcription factor [Nakamurella lactea]